MTDLVHLADARKLDTLIMRSAFAPKGLKRIREAETRAHAHAMLARECPRRGPSKRAKRRSPRRAMGVAA